MATNITVADLMHRGLRRADMDRTTLTDDGFVSFDELLEYVNTELSELYGVIQNTFEGYKRKSYTLNLVSGQEVYPLPDDFYRMIDVFPVIGTTRHRPLRRFTTEEIYNDYEYDVYSFFSSDSRYLRYRLIGMDIEFYAKPTGGTLTLDYVPQYAPLTAETDVVDIIIHPGWEDMAAAGIGARCRIKEESDPSALLLEKANARRNIEASAGPRDEGEPHRVVDIGGRFRSHSLGRPHYR